MSVPDSVGKCPPLSEEVLDRAVEAAMPDNDYKWPDLVRYLPLCAKAMAPVIAEAGYRAGIEAARAAVEDCAVDYEGTPITEVHRDDLRDALAALTDTEGRDE